ncbi:response regulator with CheY-like receiver domain and winged-helix DNA-binding domain [Schinkia azotoformans MEV2011]|uniref:Response regulator with CheY-like receiver domain and winged-helix DNA-binding domain n=1 Tax=Schinkia azotoformans MEV2011 TaxID=1348973 RepID=A0A072NJX6_SCHAZ|nr:response regulator transcription factor [Schinkia azotoformans]KEF37999.1 response regulator with CheY-like receiver domain and winged-helix DNA-binding domain [Schinkia azotoformans MEV2011]MEC1695833.1 response regulator transcription factor [Schinkia azotoformans]MEC1717285.1 response regulator transcription factor [Schinkia azotoformans]MEC1725056.1 response regulator transcription factor [Schinkia azotoformans]MEC1742705.1 response regulator transcription factor [Schinkia azotoformans]
MNYRKILVVDDEENVSELLKLYLEAENFEVHIAEDGLEALSAAKQFQPDLIILDIMLPFKDGWQVAKELRLTMDTPIIMLSAKGEESDKILGLNLGGDDYVTKPFSPGEIVARVNAIFRRSKSNGNVDKTLHFPHLTIDLSKYEVIIQDEKITTTPKEVELLWMLSSNPGQVFTRDQLLDKIWGYAYLGDTRTVDTHIKRLRRKIEGNHPYTYLQTVWGVGYKFEVIKNEKNLI